MTECLIKQTLQPLTNTWYETQCLDAKEMRSELSKHITLGEDLLCSEFYELLQRYRLMPHFGGPLQAKDPSGAVGFSFLPKKDQPIDLFPIQEFTPHCFFNNLMVYYHCERFLKSKGKLSLTPSAAASSAAYWKSLRFAKSEEKNALHIAGYMATLVHFLITLHMIETVHTHVGDQVDPCVVARMNGLIKTHLDLMNLWCENVAEEIDLTGRAMMCMPLPLLTQQLPDILYQSALFWELIEEHVNALVYFKQKYSENEYKTICGTRTFATATSATSVSVTTPQIYVEEEEKSEYIFVKSQRPKRSTVVIK